jgi:exopolysaccharide biosynthesis protein
VRNKPVALGLGVLALAGAVGIAPVGASTPAVAKLSADPIVHYYQSPSAIPGQKCLPTTRILTRTKPAPKHLPNGLTMRIWDSGKIKNPRLAVQAIRVVAVRIPAGAPAGASIFTAPNLSTAQTPTTVVSHRANIIAAVNGAIFNLRTEATPDGPQLVNGIIQKATGSYVDTLNFDKSGRMSVGELKLVASGSVSVPVNGETLVDPLPITSLNNQELTTGINVYTNVWGPKPHPAGLTEVWLKGAVQQVGTTSQFVGTIDSIRTSNLGQQPPATTADGVSTWVLTSRADNDGFFAGYGAGMPVTVALGYQTADRNNKVTTGIVAAMGRGGVYVAAGKNRANCNRGNEELRPRTLIGWNSKTGDQFFVTVQGKYQKWGVRWGGGTVHQAADYMLSLGADTAICLDGGGSTTMVVRTKVGGTPVHIDRSNPKDGQRPVVNVIGIVPMTPLPPKPTPSPSATPSASATPTVQPTP